MIRESVEPLLEEYRPPGITSLKFSKLSLGNVAPKVEGNITNILNSHDLVKLCPKSFCMLTAYTCIISSSVQVFVCKVLPKVKL